MREEMNFKSAVEAAQKDEEQGFRFLYDHTQKNMFYIALKYMKNEADAMDVLQESYIKAWKKLDRLENPEQFPAWIGRIVANTAKDALRKERPMLFSELEMEDGEELYFIYRIADERTEYQPEINYTENETRMLVHELLEALSDEQRLCILMFEFEQQSIHEIAKTFGISENTVKSRLRYGRRALRVKAEELRKQGWQFDPSASEALFSILCVKKSGNTLVVSHQCVPVIPDEILAKLRRIENFDISSEFEKICLHLRIRDGKLINVVIL